MDANNQEPEEGRTTNTEMFNRWQAITGGILSGLTKYLPHLIAVCGAAVGGVLFTIDHAKESGDHQAEVRQTETVWQHSGQWHTNFLTLAETVTNQEMELRDLEWRVENLERQSEKH